MTAKKGDDVKEHVELTANLKNKTSTNMKMTAQKDVSTKFHDGTKNKLDVIISQVDVKTHTTMTSKLFQDVKLELK